MIPCEIIIGFMLLIKTSAQGNGNIVTTNHNFGNFQTELIPSTGTINNIPHDTSNNGGLWNAGISGFPEFIGQSNGIGNGFIDSSTGGNSISPSFLLNVPSQSVNQQSSVPNTLNNPNLQQNSVNDHVNWPLESDFGQSHFGATFMTHDPGTVQQFHPTFFNTPMTNTLNTNSNVDNAIGIRDLNTSPELQQLTPSPNFDFGLQTNARESINSFSQPFQSQFDTNIQVDPVTAMMPSSSISTFDLLNSMAGPLYDPMMFFGLGDNLDLTDSGFPGVSAAISSTLSPAVATSLRIRNQPSFDFLREGSQSDIFTTNNQDSLGSAMTNNLLNIRDQPQNQFRTSVPSTTSTFQPRAQMPRGIQFLSPTTPQVERPQTITPRRFTFAMFDDQSRLPGGILFEEFQNILTSESEMQPTLKQRKKQTILVTKERVKPVQIKQHVQKPILSRNSGNNNETY